MTVRRGRDCRRPPPLLLAVPGRRQSRTKRGGIAGERGSPRRSVNRARPAPKKEGRLSNAHPNGARRIIGNARDTRRPSAKRKSCGAVQPEELLNP